MLLFIFHHHIIAFLTMIFCVLSNEIYKQSLSEAVGGNVKWVLYDDIKQKCPEKINDYNMNTSIPSEEENLHSLCSGYMTGRWCVKYEDKCKYPYKVLVVVITI